MYLPVDSNRSPLQRKWKEASSVFVWVVPPRHQHFGWEARSITKTRSCLLHYNYICMHQRGERERDSGDFVRMMLDAFTDNGQAHLSPTTALSLAYFMGCTYPMDQWIDIGYCQSYRDSVSARNERMHESCPLSHSNQRDPVYGRMNTVQLGVTAWTW